MIITVKTHKDDKHVAVFFKDIKVGDIFVCNPIDPSRVYLMTDAGPVNIGVGHKGRLVKFTDSFEVFLCHAKEIVLVLE